MRPAARHQRPPAERLEAGSASLFTALEVQALAIQELLR
jgi:hypothetical protein